MTYRYCYQFYLILGLMTKSPEKITENTSTQVEDIEYLPASHCHVYLKVTAVLTSLRFWKLLFVCC